MVSDDYITVREAAQMLGRGTTRIRQHIRDGRIRSMVKHGIVWVLKADVERIPSLMRRYEKHVPPIPPNGATTRKRGKNRRVAKVAKAANMVTTAKSANPAKADKPENVENVGRSAEP